MRTTKVKASVIGATIAVLLLAGCTSDSDSSGGDTGGTGAAASGTLAVNWGAFPESWAPGAEMEGGPLRIAYETLVTLDADREVAPMLATEWEQTDEALTLTLREGVTFHDGTPFDAEAVKVNLESVRDGTTAFAGQLASIESIDAVDDTTVRLNLSEPTPSLLTTLTTRVAPMGSPQAIEDGSIAQAPVGTGPWAYDEGSSTTGTRMSFGLYEDYWGGADAVGFQTIELYAIPDDSAAAAALQSGEIDITDTEPEQLQALEAAGNVETLAYPAIRNNPIFFDRGPGGMFEDVRVRQAACYAIDTEQQVELEADQATSTQHFAEGEIGYNPDVEGYQHDLDRARELYEEAGSPPVSAEVIAAPFNQQQFTVFASQMAEIGMDIRVQQVPPPQFFSEWNSGRYPIGLGSVDELTPFEWYRAWWAADAPGNPAGVESDELREAADAAIAAGTSEEASDLWAEVTRIVADEALTCAHIIAEELIAWNTDSVQGVSQPTEPWEANLVNYRDLRPAG